MTTDRQIAPYVQRSIQLSDHLVSDPQWERLWLQTIERHWRCLAVVPAGPGAGPNFSIEVAMNLARTGMAHLGQQIHVADATGVRLGNNGVFLAHLRQAMESGPVLVALAPCAENPVTSPVARGTDGTILCARLGAMKIRDVARTVQEIGRQHIICAAAIDDPPPRKK